MNLSEFIEETFSEILAGVRVCKARNARMSVPFLVMLGSGSTLQRQTNGVAQALNRYARLVMRSDSCQRSMRRPGGRLRWIV